MVAQKETLVTDNGVDKNLQTVLKSIRKHIVWIPLLIIQCDTPKGDSCSYLQNGIRAG